MHGAIGYSYSSGNVVGEDKVGGLVGEVDVREISIEHSFQLLLFLEVIVLLALSASHQTVSIIIL